jgi:hypothetical protein
MSWRSEVEERWRGREETSERRDPLPVCPSQLQRLFNLLVFPNLSADYIVHDAYAERNWKFFLSNLTADKNNFYN